MTISTENFISVNVGATANDGTGDELRTAFTKVNQNFSNISGKGFVAGNIDVTNSIEADGNITASYINGNVITANSAVVSGDLDLTGDTTLNGDAVVTGTLEIQGNTTADIIYANAVLSQAGGSLLTDYQGNIGALEVLGNLTSSGNIIVANTYVPVSNSSIGTAGQMVWDQDYVYICVDTNTWKRANLSTW